MVLNLPFSPRHGPLGPGPSGCEAGDDAFGDEFAFEFGEGGDCPEDQLPGEGNGAVVVSMAAPSDQRCMPRSISAPAQWPYWAGRAPGSGLAAGASRRGMCVPRPGGSNAVGQCPHLTVSAQREGPHSRAVIAGRS